MIAKSNVVLMTRVKFVTDDNLTIFIRFTSFQKYES